MREQKTISIPSEKEYGRDKSKIFRLTEMSSVNLELWSSRFVAHVKNVRGKLPEDTIKKIEEVSATEAVSDLLKSMSKEDLSVYIKLLNELMSCYEIFDSALGTYVKITDDNIGDYVDEVHTLQFLREESLGFNMRFLAESPSPTEQRCADKEKSA